MTDGYTVAHLLPRDTPRQRVAESVVNVTPEPSERDEHVDAFGNRVTQFGVHHPHDELVVEAVSTADVDDPVPIRRRRVVERRGRSRRSVAGRRSSRDRPVPGADSLRRSQPRRRRAGRHRVRIVHAGPGDRRGRQRPVPPDLRRVHVRLDGDRRLEPLADVLASRRGVCQDFAHLAAGCLRSIGLAARYVSGYIETTPPAGRDRARRRRRVARVVLDLDTVGGLDRLRSDERPLPDPPPRHGRAGVATTPTSRRSAVW